MELSLDGRAIALLDRLPPDRPFTTFMAAEVGISRQALHRLVVLGALRHPVRSGYLRNDVPDSIEIRIALLELIVPDGCFIADHTAAYLHAGEGVLLPNAHLARPRPDVLRHPGRRALRNPLVRSGERAVSRRDLMRIGSVVVTTPLRTGCDLLRLQRRDVAMWGMCSMLGTGTFTIEEVFAEIPRWRGARGVVQLRALAPLADGLVESFGEAALLLRWHDAGLPRPRCQISVMDGGHEVFRIDIGLEEMAFGGEYDGEEFHDETTREHDEGRRGWLAEDRGWWIEVFRRIHVFGQHQNAEARLRRGYELVRAQRRVPTYLT